MIKDKRRMTEDVFKIKEIADDSLNWEVHLYDVCKWLKSYGIDYSRWGDKMTVPYDDYSGPIEGEADTFESLPDPKFEGYTTDDYVELPVNVLGERITLESGVWRVKHTGAYYYSRTDSLLGRGAGGWVHEWYELEKISVIPFFDLCFDSHSNISSIVGAGEPKEFTRYPCHLFSKPKKTEPKKRLFFRKDEGELGYIIPRFDPIYAIKNTVYERDCFLYPGDKLVIKNRELHIKKKEK